MAFRDRFYTRPVARSITSPLGILLAGAGAAAGIVLGLGPIGAVAIGLGAWAARVLAAVPGRDRPAAIDPFTLKEPWRRAVQDALQARNRFYSAVKEARSGPMRERLTEIAARVDDGVEQAWRAAQQGQTLVLARRHIDADEARRDLAALEPDARPELAAALQAQIDSAGRLDAAIDDASARLRLTGARLDEAVARAVELSVRTDDVAQLEGLGDDVEGLVTDLEALRQGLEAVDRPALGS